MTIKRKRVGDVVNYRGHEIEVRFLGPDLLCYVDGSELSPFYETLDNARKAGERHIDLMIKAESE
jgi:hypothetical protein